MRKSLIVLLSILLVVGFSVSAFALHKSPESEYNPGMVTKKGVQIEMSGSIRSRGELKVNVKNFEDDSGDHDAAFDTRVRLKLKARVTPQTYGVVELETGDQNADTYKWGLTDSGATGNIGAGLGNRKQGDLTIRQAYIAHQGKGLVGRTAGVKVGHILVALGNGLYLDHTKFGDDAIILWAEAGPGEVAFAYVKFDEGAGSKSDDINAYALTIDLPLDNINIGADVSYVDGQAVSTDGLHLWNFGARGDVTFTGLTLRGDLEVQTGEADGTGALGTDVDFSGWAGLVGVDYEIAGITLSGEFAYGSGDDDPTDNDEASFVTTLGGSQHYTYVYEYRTVSAVQTGGACPAATGGNCKGTGLTNTWYINVGASTKPIPDLKVSGDIYYLRASEDVNIMSAAADKADDLGWEIDGKIEYKIDRNLLYYIEGGILFSGDAYDIAHNESADNAYAIRNGIVLKF